MPRRSPLSGTLAVALLALWAGTPLVAEDGGINVGFFGFLGDRAQVRNTPTMTAPGTVPAEAFAALAQGASLCVQVEVRSTACVFNGEKPVKNAKGRYEQHYIVFGPVDDDRLPLPGGTYSRYLLKSGRFKTGADGCARWTNTFSTPPPGTPPAPEDLIPPELETPPPIIETQGKFTNRKKGTQTQLESDLDMLPAYVSIC